MGRENNVIYSGLQRRPQIKDYPDVLNIVELSEILGVSTKTGYAVLKHGHIDYIKVGRSYRIPKQSLLRYLGSATR